MRNLFSLFLLMKQARLGIGVMNPLLPMCLCACLPAFSQVQWASKLVAVSSEFSSANGQQYKGTQALGKPTKLPQAEEGATAWRPNLEEGGEEWIMVEFAKPINVQQIAIAQNYGGGCIKKIVFSDDSVPTKETSINISNASKAPLFIHKLLKPTTFKATFARVYLDTKLVKGWNEIDAIGISETLAPITISINTASDIPKNLKPENLGANVNTMANEVTPVISPDGQTIYFTRVNDGSMDHDVWLSEQNSGQWQKAKNIGTPINNQSVNSIAYISPDDRTALLMNQYLPNGSMAQGASFSKKMASGWQFPRSLDIPNYANYQKDGIAAFHIGPEGNTMILSMQNNQTVGDADLYVSFLQSNGSWSEPKNLGATINTAEGEFTPFLATDNSTLYFSSFGRGGYGESDIFLSRRLDESWTNWSEPENLGAAFNTDGVDGHFTIPASGEYAYFASTTDKNGWDLFRTKLPEKLRPVATTLLKGTVIDQKTNQPIDAEVVIKDLEQKKQPQNLAYDPAVGDFKLILENQKQYGLTAQKPGYQSASMVIDLSNEKKYQELQKNIFLAPIEVGQKITLNALLFKQSLAEMLPTSVPELERLRDLMLQNPTMEILLEGHTDNIGDFDANLKLSKERVEAVKKYLISNNITQTRIQTKGLGGTQPVSSNSQELTRKLNRRVELTILKK